MSNLTTKLIGTTPVGGAVEAQAIDFDGTNDYLSRSTDLVGNADSKTFTFSAWVWIDDTGDSQRVVSSRESTDEFSVVVSNTETLAINCLNSGSLIFQWLSAAGGVPLNTFVHILASFDTDNQSGSKVYINDVLSSGSFGSFTTGGVIPFTNSSWAVATDALDLDQKVKGRLSNVYLDYTYRDLSVEGNRRLFVDYDDDGGLVPASGQASLSPILYLPMDDPDDPGRNDGTGGDFTLNGTIARSGRGPNQYNAPASTFDGSADYLSRSNPLSPTKTVTASAWVFVTNDGTIINERDIFRFSTNLSGEVRFDILALNSSATIIAQVRSSRGYATNKWYSVQVAVDLGNSIVDIYINGVRDVDSVLDLTDDTIDFGGILGVAAEGSTGGQTIGANISDVWMDDTYIDLSANNPFYDVETSKPKFLGENGELPTGSSPLIYLPLRADDAGNNKGTGGDFTVNSGPFTGARGPSEFWGESAEFNGSSQYLSTTSLTGLADSKVFSFACAFYQDVVSADTLFAISAPGASANNFRIVHGAADPGSLTIIGSNSGGSIILDFGVASVMPVNEWVTLLVSVDLENGVSNVYINGSQITDSGEVLTNDNLNFSAADVIYVGAEENSDTVRQWFDGKIGFLWFNTEYIDFSQEANRLKFFDAFNYPVDLGEDGSLPTGNQPLIYLNNDFHLGTNLGSGGDFTPVNTPTDGGFVKG